MTASPKVGLDRAKTGRAKGTPNKSTRKAKEAIEFAADKLGGGERLAAWAAESPENERSFWATIYPKLLPLQVTGEGGGPLSVVFKTVYEPNGN